jgi:predicted PhzF superfamily epimerase YddE/YHI9
MASNFTPIFQVDAFTTRRFEGNPAGIGMRYEALPMPRLMVRGED